MTDEEAYKKLQANYVFIAEGIFGSYEVTDLLFAALEKQIPKKPVCRKSGFKSIYYECPCCRRYFVSILDGELCAGRKYPYCFGCGQAIDWEDTE